MTLRRPLVAALMAAALGTFSPAEALSVTELRVATLAPKASSWGKIFRVWQKAVSDKTRGELKLEVYYNGVHGMEAAMVGKVKSRQLDGAVVSSVGLAEIYRDVLALQLPGLITDWPTLDRVRNTMAPEIEKGFTDAGFSLVSWADVGLVRPFSAGFAVRTPAAIKGKRPLVYSDDPILPTLYQTIGGVVPTPTRVMEVLPALRTGTANVIFAPGLAVEQLQWAPHLDHVTDWIMVCVIGGTVFRKDSIDAMPSDVRATFLEIQKRVGEIQTKQVRKDDQAAYDRVSKRMKVEKLGPSEKKAWDDLAREAVRRLSQATFPRPVVERVAKVAGRAI